MQRILAGPCPVCAREISYVYTTEEIPYFSEVLIQSASCPCGFRFTDIIVLTEQEPVMWEMRIEDEHDLTARVVRSSTGTIRLPDIGVNIEPGIACEGFISNVEGVLDRVGEVVDKVIGWSTGEELARAESLKRKIKLLRDAQEPFTLIIEDPQGNSAIISRKAHKTVLGHSDTEKP